MKKNLKVLVLVLAAGLVIDALAASMAQAQDVLPADNGLATYHTAPRYRESESHPLRIVGYVLHPIGWVAREVLFRPLSYFASSSETRKSIMGYREPFDYRTPECFSADDSVPDCRSIVPFNYDAAGKDDTASLAQESDRSVYFPNINFDFDVRKLNQLGQGRARQVAAMLKEKPGIKVVLQGHADYMGSDKYNEKLGLDRAEAVRQELLAQGVSPERLSTVTFGETQPLLNEQTDWARAVNRRVEVHPDSGETVEAESVH